MAALICLCHHTVSNLHEHESCATGPSQLLSNLCHKPGLFCTSCYFHILYLLLLLMFTVLRKASQIWYNTGNNWQCTTVHIKIHYLSIC